MNTSLVSIVIPVYNKESYLENCVNSVIKQSYTNIELILVDDGSTDGSGKLCDVLAQKDDRIKVFHKQNGGANAARKDGVLKSIGEWVMFVDADDVVTTKGLEYLMMVNDGNYDIIAGAINKENRLFGNKVDGILTKEEYISALLTVQTTDGPVAKLFKRNLFESFDWQVPKEIYLNEDMLMLIGLATGVTKVYVTSDIICYNYILYGNSASSGVMPYSSWIKLFDLIENYIGPYMKTHKEIDRSFCIYRLKTVLNNVVTHGVYPSRNDEYLRKLFADCIPFMKDQDISEMVKKLKSKRQMRKQYIQNKPIIIRINLIKKMILGVFVKKS